MFFAPPAVQHPSGDLTLPLRPDAFGTINLRVKAVDTGGRDNGGFDESSEKLLRVTVSPINDPPYVVYGSNTKGNTLRILEDTPDTISAFVKEFHPGPREEGLQTVSVVSSGAYSSGLIDTLQVFSDGAVSIIPKKDQNGFSFGWIEIQDSGGVANGGSDRSTVNISVEVVPVNDPPSLTLAKSHVTVDEDCGIATIADVIFDVTPGPPDESGQQIFYRVTVDTPELFVALPEISPAGVLRFSAAPDYSGEIPAKIQACDDGGNANGGTPCSTMSDFTFRISPVNDRPSFVPGTPVITVSNNIGAYTAQWAMQVSGGPLDEAQDELAFIVTRVSDASLFLDGGAPSVAPDGVLSFQANSQRAGNATVWIALRDKEGARSPEYVLRVETTDPSEAPLVAVLDQLYDEFSILGFKQAVARAVSVPTECITVIRTQPATVRVNFRFNRGCGGVTAASLNRQYMAAIADESSQLRTDLRLVESYSEGTRSTQLNLDNLDRTNTNLVRLPNGEYTTRDSGASTGASQSVLIILLVLLGVAMLAGAVLLFWCLKRFRRRSRRQEGQAEAERHAAEQQAYDERGWESHAAVEHVEADPDLLPPEGLPAPRAYHEGSPGGEGGVGSLGSSGGSAVSHISNTHYLTAVPTDPSLDGGGAGSSDAGSANPIDLAFGAAPQRRRGSAASAVQHQQQRHSVRFDLRPPINPLLQDNSPAAAASGHPTRPLGVQAAGLAEPGRAEAAGWKARQQPQRDTQGGQIQGLAPHRALRYGGVADADGDDAAAAAAAPALSADRLRLVMGLRGGGEGGGGVAGHRRAPSDLSSRVSGGGASEEEIVVG